MHGPRFNEPLYNELLGITNDILQPGQSYSEMYGTEPRYNEILVITSTIQNPKRKMYLDITNKCQHASKDEVVFCCLSIIDQKLMIVKKGNVLLCGLVEVSAIPFRSLDDFIVISGLILRLGCLFVRISLHRGPLNRGFVPSQAVQAHAESEDHVA